MPACRNSIIFCRTEKILSKKTTGYGPLRFPSTDISPREYCNRSPAFYISHGDYFTAVRNFLEQDGYEIITRAVSQQTRRDITSEEIEEIRIFLEKHGEFYHPARIETVLARRQSVCIECRCFGYRKAVCAEKSIGF